MTLTIKVEASPGDDLQEAMVEMIRVAQVTGCLVEMRGNGTIFWVRPENTEAEVRAAFKEFYPASDYVQVGGRISKRVKP